MMGCVSHVTLASGIKDYIPRFSEVQVAPERKSNVLVDSPQNEKQEKRPKGEIQNIVQASFKGPKEIPRGPNSVFNFADYLNQNSTA